jgi:hypothetical protein
MKIRVITGALAVAVLATASCNEPAPTEVSSPASELNLAVTQNAKDLHWEGLLAGEPCGDQVWVEAMEHWVVKYTEGPSGRVLSGWHYNGSGTGVGTPSGNTWKLRWQGNAYVAKDGTDGWPFVRHYVHDGVLIGHGNAPNITFKVNNKLTINASGDVTVNRRLSDIKCQGY